MLGDLQDRLTDLYQVETGYHIDDFLITDPALARLLGQDRLLTDTEETLLLREEDDGVAISVFLDEALLERLSRQDPLRALRPEQLDDLWTVIEGVSHFTYLVFSAGRDRPVTLLELELQAEIDKYVSTWLIALQQDDRELAARLHGWLFDDVSFRADLDASQHARYRAANAYAARFCHRLRSRLEAGGHEGLDELRHFYRLTQGRKIGHIHSQTWWGVRGGWGQSP